MRISNLDESTNSPIRNTPWDTAHSQTLSLMVETNVPKMKVDFDLARKKDVPEILTMMEQFNSIDNYPFDRVKTEINLLEFLADQNLGRTWLIKIEHLVIGYFVLAYGFSFEYGGRDAFIDELYLKSEYRRKGIGRLVIDFIKQQAPKLGVGVIHLEVEQHNAGGVKLYTETGFKENGRKLLSLKVKNDNEIGSTGNK